MTVLDLRPACAWGTIVVAGKDGVMDNRRRTPITATPTDGYELAIRFSRMVIKAAQPDAVLRDRARPDHAEDAASPIAVAQAVTTKFATNDHRRGSR